jgi:hypothetical protein
MSRKWTTIAIALGFTFLLAFAVGSLYPQEEKTGEEDVEKIARKIIISKDQAIVDGDTFDLEDLEEDLRHIGELDITIIGLDDWDDEGMVTDKRNEVVKFGGDVRVEEWEKIDGSVVVFGGTATIAGVVKEDAVVLGGDLIIEETADIRGSAVCFGGEIEKEQGAKIGDQEVSLGNFPCGAMTVGPFIGYNGFGGFFDRGVGFFAGIILLGVLLLLGAGAIFFFPNAFGRISETVGDNLLKTGLVGLLGEILILPMFVVVTVVLAVSIIGIPLLFLVIPLAVLGLVAAVFMGYIGTGMFVGRKIGERASWSVSSPYRIMLIGVIALLAFDILAAIIGIASVLWPIQVVFGIVGGIITYLAVTVGFGAVILTRFGTRPFEAAQAVKQEITEE